MPVQYMNDGDEAIVTVDGAKHHFSIEDGDTADLEAYSYEGPAEEAPDEVLQELEAHVDEHLQESVVVDELEEEPPEPEDVDDDQEDDLPEFEELTEGDE